MRLSRSNGLSTRARVFAFYLLSIFLIQVCYAESDRGDYDLDDDGLIEINDLADLNAMRNSLDGTALYGVNTGCPITGCFGFELTTHLDFDTNGNGQIDAGDSYWNSGQGWAPIGNQTTPFAAEFNGNGYTLENLYISKTAVSSIEAQGLFGYSSGAQLHDVLIEVDISGDEYVGALVGRASATQIDRVAATGKVQSANGYVGGIAGFVLNSALEGVAFAGRVSSSQKNVVGGITGLSQGSTIKVALMTGEVSGYSSVGGLVGASFSPPQTPSYQGFYVNARVTADTKVGGVFGEQSQDTTHNGYWSTDVTGHTLGVKANLGNSFVGVSRAGLTCAVANTTADNSSCDLTSPQGAPITLFKQWDELTFVDASAQLQNYWLEYGSAAELPALNLGWMSVSDRDGDGVLDGDDAWDDDPAVALDADSDGYPDAWTAQCDALCRADSTFQIDQFPSSGLAYGDTDLDGLVDGWADTCDATCRADSGLPIDEHPNDVDNDGIPDAQDTDTHGVANADANNNGLIDIADLTALNAMRYQLDGQGQRLSADGALVISGCPVVVFEGLLARRCHGYELANDLDFDTDASGAFDAADSFWNAGQGWLPIGTDAARFSAEFDGNGHTLRHFGLNRSSSYNGLFGVVGNNHIHDLVIKGQVQGANYTGMLAALALFSRIERVVVAGLVAGDSYVGGAVGAMDGGELIGALMAGGVDASTGQRIGGLVGQLNGSAAVKTSMASGWVSGSGYVGGLVGAYGSSQIQITDSLAHNRVTGNSNTGGALGYLDGLAVLTVRDVYWAADYAQQSGVVTSGDQYNVVGLTRETLQCVVVADADSDQGACFNAQDQTPGSYVLYHQWDALTWQTETGQTQPYWDYGTAQQLPGLHLASGVYRDADGDGYLDEDDVFEYDPAVALDADADGYADAWNPQCDNACQAASLVLLDQFPTHSMAYGDTDLDGLVDAWAPNCDQACRDSSGLTQDPFPNDLDNDGLIDALDPQDNNPNNDGPVDVDSDSDGLIDIAALNTLNAMRHQLDGAGLRLTDSGELNDSGCPAVLYAGRYVRRCTGYELTQDLTFDTSGDGELSDADAYWNEGAGWQPIGTSDDAFTAVLEGNGHTLHRVFINRPSSNLVGVFGATQNANIRNLNLALVEVIGQYDVGAVVGLAQATQIQQMNIAAAVQGSGRIGGLVGTMEAGRVEFVAVEGQLSCAVSQPECTHVGGLVGQGRSNAALRSSQMHGQVSGHQYLGGILGNANQVSLNGLAYVGTLTATGSDAGGVVGNVSSGSTLKNSFVVGHVGSATNNVGGIVGRLGPATHIDNVHMSGRVSGEEYVGGVVGNWASLSSSVTSSFAHAEIEAAQSGGGLIGGGGQITGLVIDSYWANDLPGASSSHGQSELHSVVGVSSMTLKCALQGSTHAGNSDCVSADGSDEGLAQGMTLFNRWETQGETNGQGQFVPYWAFGNAGALPYLTQWAQAEQDQDGDGQTNPTDAYPHDFDNDGVDDLQDRFPLISLAGRIDTDGDGTPNECDASCLATGMTADLDDDGDGYLDDIDLFPLDGTEWADFDGDGLGDNADTDDDNDGVEDQLDPALGEDNGAPTLLPLDLAERHVSVSDDAGQHGQAQFDQAYFDAMGASDVYDAQVDIEVRVDGNLATLAAGNLRLSAGRRVVNWYAVDSAGNRSAPLSQIVNVYPRVGFVSETSVTGEPSNALISVRLTGDSPVYPVHVRLLASELSDVQQADFDAGFALDAQHTVSIAAGTEAQLNREGQLSVPVAADEVAENDEQLILTLLGADAGGDTAQWFAVQLTQTEHSLTLTDRNLPPVVTLRVLQGGEETLVIERQGGLVTVLAEITDPNGLDQHNVEWLVGDLTQTTAVGNKLTIDPVNVAVGEYKLTIRVTDDGVAPEMVEQSVLITVQGQSHTPEPETPAPEVPSPQTPPAKSSGSGGGGGGGSLAPWLLFSLLWLKRRRRQWPAGC